MANPSRTVSVNAMASELDTYTASWRASVFSEQLRSLLLSRSEKWTVDRALVIGLGRMTPPQLDQKTDEEYRKFRRNILCQTMIFQEIVNILSSAQDGRSIKMFASDPDFDELDKELLEHLGVTVVDEGVDLVTEKTFVYSPFAPCPVGHRAIRRSPELYVGLSWSWCVGRCYDPQDPSKAIMTMEEYAVCEAFSNERVENIFPGLEKFPEPVPKHTKRDRLKEWQSDAEILSVTYRALRGPFRLYWPKPAPHPAKEEDIHSK